jgi:hypothetical protein
MTSKPVLIWIVQLLLGLLGSVTLYFSTYMDAGFIRILFGALGLVYLSVVVGLQLRHTWARWAAIALLALLSAGTLLAVANGAARQTPLQSVVAVVVFLPLTWLLAFTEPARRYFTSKTKTTAP